MTNKSLVAPNSKEILSNMKYEIARELGVTLGADTTSRMNGSVGGEMTRRLVELGKQNLR
ncbi:MAG: alpha/beta-type small acid-soluble spore protein [Lactobacillales bacterium]|nr:alpha/beta-type small acid-soluble spore protein [Lactobacillales bacterium]